MTTLTYTTKHGYKTGVSLLSGWMDATDSTTDLAGFHDLTENGTLFKSAANTGTSEFQYTGFSAVNYLSYAYHSDFDLTGGSPAIPGHTLMAWVNVGTVSTVETIMDRHDVGGTGARWALQINADGTISAIIDDGVDTLQTDTTTSIDSAGWTHIAVTWDDVDTQTIYINGQSDTIDTGGSLVGSLINGSAIFQIGLDCQGSNPLDQGLTMARVHNGILSATDISDIHVSDSIVFQPYETFVAYNAPYTFTFPAMQIMRGAMANRSVKTSIGGVQQVLFNREDVTWDFTTTEMQGALVLTMQHMLSAVLQGDTLVIDPYDASEDFNCVMVSNAYSATRIETTNYFTFSFKVKEL